MASISLIAICIFLDMKQYIYIIWNLFFKMPTWVDRFESVYKIKVDTLLCHINDYQIGVLRLNKWEFFYYIVFVSFTYVRSSKIESTIELVAKILC